MKNHVHIVGESYRNLLESYVDSTTRIPCRLQCKDFKIKFKDVGRMNYIVEFSFVFFHEND